jgi:hypothetical protein
MSATAKPYGLRPINLIGGQQFSGSTRAIKIASGYATNIFKGSVVAIVAAGTVEIVTTVGSAASAFPAGTVGVFMGCFYTAANGTPTWSQFWPTGTVAADAVACIIDDPDVLFQGQCDGTVGQTGLGQNLPFAAAQSTSTGSTVTGNSNSALDASTATTTGIGFRIVDFVASSESSVGDAFTDVIVKFNPGSHSYTNPVGI